MKFRHFLTLVVVLVFSWALFISAFICTRLSLFDSYLTFAVTSLFTSIYLVLSCIMYFIEQCFQCCYEFS